ncbi:hypothetical protein WG899_14030 [Paucibacter sp. AS339]|uniref:hypothetical protein n=1 Tax=Paucibacter hankyongi TaxID=3133434 RepID=UPI0030B1EDEE
MSLVQRRLIQLAASLACGLMAHAPVHADANPYYFGGSLALNHVSNIYRTSAAPNDDNVATASLLAGINQTLGRQRLFADASINTNRYSKSSDLNYVGYTLKGGLDWSTVERLSGTISVNNSRNLSTYNERGTTQIRKQNIEDNKQLDGVVRLGLVTRFSLEAGAGYRTRSFSASEYDAYEFSQNRYSLGLVYQASPDLRLGVAGRLTRDHYPAYSREGLVLINGKPVLVSIPVEAREFERKDLDFTGRWVLSGASSLDGRISTGRSYAKAGGGNDFSGVTGALTWNWQPTAKLTVSSTISRDTGLESSFINANTSADRDRLSNALQVNANYELTGKIFLNAGISIVNSDARNSTQTSSVDEFDRDKAFNLGLRWQYSRGITLGCQYSKSSRDSDSARQIYAYDASNYGCYGQIILY